MAWFRKSKDPAEVVRVLREQIFTMSPNDVGISPAPGHSRVWAVVMETGYPIAVASLVAIADGTTSLYLSNGGGVIGAGAHKKVQDASTRFIALVDAHVDAFSATDSHDLPQLGRVRFYVRTFDDLRTLEADERELGEGRHGLSQLFHAGHAVIAAVREASPPT